MRLGNAAAASGHGTEADVGFRPGTGADVDVDLLGAGIPHQAAANFGPRSTDFEHQPRVHRTSFCTRIT